MCVCENILSSTFFYEIAENDLSVLQTLPTIGFSGHNCCCNLLITLSHKLATKTTKAIIPEFSSNFCFSWEAIETVHSKASVQPLAIPCSLHLHQTHFTVSITIECLKHILEEEFGGIIHLNSYVLALCLQANTIFIPQASNCKPSSHEKVNYSDVASIYIERLTCHRGPKGSGSCPNL